VSQPVAVVVRLNDDAAERESIDNGWAEPGIGGVLVQLEKASSLAMAMAFFSSRSASTWNGNSAPGSTRCQAGD
jgi:hypothetical protein